MNLFSRLLVGTLVVVAHASTAWAQSTPLFGSAPSTNGFAALTLDQRDGQVIAQPFTVITPVLVGDISLPVFASAAFDFRIQLVTALGPDNARSPVADQSYVFDFTGAAGTGQFAAYQQTWANLTVDQDLAPGTYFLVMSSHAPLIVTTSPIVFGIGWGRALFNVDIPGSEQFATIPEGMVASNMPFLSPPSFVDAVNPQSSFFVPLGRGERYTFVAYSGVGGPFPPPIPEPQTWAFMLAGLLVVCAAANGKRGSARG